MVRNPLTGEWSFLPVELWQEQDHQGHVQLWWWHKLVQAAFGKPEVPVWGRSCPARYPSIAEDPAAYAYGFD